MKKYLILILILIMITLIFSGCTKVAQDKTHDMLNDSQKIVELDCYKKCPEDHTLYY